ncbi:hypothetical protein Nepgr_009237 [Nepenthes gracilis]|uniref:Uncharacterized protein n=1 Tax=Nepenthes gracilis TaxID=150966 RepID=A0AAD3SB22_NEPGR|nr:hypothetical protein Nepgr_009237 [Nepenthes gracilis]
MGKEAFIAPKLSCAFNIKRKPNQTVVEVNLASPNTLSGLRCQAPTKGFKSFDENRSPGDVIVDENDEGTRKVTWFSVQKFVYRVANYLELKPLKGAKFLISDPVDMGKARIDKKTPAA